MSDRITTPFTAGSTADEVSEGVDLTGSRAIVTGGASGIGTETTRTLARRGAAVTLAVRNVEAGRKVAAEITAETGGPSIDVRPLELTDLASVRRFVDGWDEPLDLLVNNAGVMAIQERTFNDAGWEAQFATNYLGHLALTSGLHRWLARGDGARVVCVSSSGHLFSPVVFDDINFRFRPYDPLLAYGQSKTAVILFAVAASSRWADDGITVNTLNPGAIATPLQRHSGGKLATPVDLQKTPAQGAATTLLLATSPTLAGIGGRYFNDNQEAVPVDERPSDITELVNSVAAYALDRDNAERLWNLGAAATGEADTRADHRG
jgi:NAD(P)-dependent dehydrogenase (short-subunit alcohol dehydrogenase family)